MTRIIPGVEKDAAFRKGCVRRGYSCAGCPWVRNTCTFGRRTRTNTMKTKRRNLCKMCKNEYMDAGQVKEGKVELFAAIDGLFKIDEEKKRNQCLRK